MYHRQKMRSYSHFKPHQALPGAAFLLSVCKKYLYAAHFFKLSTANTLSDVGGSVFQLSQNLYVCMRTRKWGAGGDQPPAARRQGAATRPSVRQHDGGVVGVRRRARGRPKCWRESASILAGGAAPLAASPDAAGGQGDSPGKLGTYRCHNLYGRTK